MNADELRRHAAHNQDVFEQALAPYVALKLEHAARPLEAGAREAWFDASGCVWCLFDDPSFVRCGNEATALQEALGTSFNLQVFWSMGDVVMPYERDEHWVAERIAKEATLQLPQLGFRCKPQSRQVDGERHEGVLIKRKRRFF